MAYGSDAFGGVIYARTRRIDPAAPLAGRVVGALGAGAPQGRIGAEISKGLGKGGIALQAHYRDFDDYRSPQGDVFNSGATDQGFLARGEYELGKGLLGASWQSDFGSDIGRPRNNSTTVRFYYPVEDSHRFTSTYDLRQVGGFERVTINTFVGSYRQVTDQDRYATATRGRTLEEADYEANDFQVRASAERLFSAARFEMGVDVNGRFNVHATDTVTNYALDGSVDQRGLQRVDRGGAAERHRRLRLRRGGDQPEGHGGRRHPRRLHDQQQQRRLLRRAPDARTAPCRAAGRSPSGPGPACRSSCRPAAGSATRPSRTATIAGRLAGVTSPATPI